MSFVKHAIFLGEDSPKLTDYDEVTNYILNRLKKENILISEGIVDHLDHSSPEQFVGGKLGIDVTSEPINELGIEILEDGELLKLFKEIDENVVDLKQFKKDTKNPVVVIRYDKKRSAKELFKEIENLKKYIKILVVVDNKNNDLENPYMLIWRVVNNIDAKRDIVLEPFIMVDATNKNELDGFKREWPKDVVCDKDVLESLKKRGIVDIDENFIKKYGLVDEDW